MKQKLLIPTPKKLLSKAKKLPPGVALADYSEVMWTLKKEKGLSLREIAAWLTKELMVSITHMQVYRAMQASLGEPALIEPEQLGQMREELDEERKT